MSAERDTEKGAAADRRESGTPGGGQGRRDEVGGSGVYPASAPDAPDDAVLRTQAEWGQGERGAEGAEDTGPSELHLSEEELRALDERSEEQRADRRDSSMNDSGTEPRSRPSEKGGGDAG